MGTKSVKRTQWKQISVIFLYKKKKIVNEIYIETKQHNRTNLITLYEKIMIIM